MASRCGRRAVVDLQRYPPWYRFRSKDLGCQLQTVEYQRPEIGGLWPVLCNKLEPTFVDDLRPARDTLETRSRSGLLQVLDLTRRLAQITSAIGKGYRYTRSRGGVNEESSRAGR